MADPDDVKRVLAGDKDLKEADLSGSDLRGARLLTVNLSGANLKGANLKGANLSDSNLSCADLSDARLIDANMSHADLNGANLTGAILTYALLSYADLGEADLSWADLNGVDLSGVDLSGADLRRAELSGTGIVRAYSTYEFTRYPDGRISYGCCTYSRDEWLERLPAIARVHIPYSPERSAKLVREMRALIAWSDCASTVKSEDQQKPLESLSTEELRAELERREEDNHG